MNYRISSRKQNRRSGPRARTSSAQRPRLSEPLEPARSPRPSEQAAAAMRIARMAQWEYDIQRGVILLNEPFYRLFGFSAAKVGGYSLPIADFVQLMVHPEEVERITDHVRAARETTDPAFEQDFVSRMVRADGETRWVRIWFSIEKDADGCTVRVLGVTQDIHEQREAELKQRLTQYAVDSSADATFFMDQSGRILYANESACRSLGYRAEELLGLTVSDFNPNFPADRWPEHWAEMRLQGSRSFESLHRAKDGRTFPVEVHSNHVEFEGKEYHYTFVRDISERKAAEKALHESEARNLALLNSNPDLMFLNRRDGVFVDTYVRSVNKLLLPPEQFLGKNLNEIFIPDLAQRFLRAYALALDEGQEQIVEYTLPFAGQPRHYEARIIRCYEDVVMTLVRDIQERKEAELVLQQANAEAQRTLALFQALLNAIPLPVFYKDTNDRFLGCNEAYQKLVNLPADQIIGRTSREFMSDDYGELFQQKDLELFRDQGQQAYEHHYQTHTGEIRNLLNFKTVFLNEKGDVAGLIGAIVDITDRKRAEEEVQRLNEELENRVHLRTAQLEETNRELDSFVHTASHDLRAPLRSLAGFSQALIEDYSERLDATGLDYLTRIRAAAQRMGQIIDGLLNLSQLNRAEPRLAGVDLSRMAAEVGAKLRIGFPERGVELIIQPDMRVQADPGLIRILLYELLDNAWKFTNRAPLARIEVGAAADAGRTTIFVRDNGVGFDMTYAHKLFSVFERLHDARDYTGIGLGLAVAQRIMQRHGGEIWAESQPGQGATFYFSFPSSSGQTG